MKIFKKILTVMISSVLLFVESPVFSFDSSQLTLQEFLDSNKKIKVVYSYPSTKLAYYNDSLNKGASVNRIKIPAGTPVIVKSVDTLNSGTLISGTEVSFKTIKDVKLDDRLLIKAGADVQARVTYAKKKGMVGEPGVIQISDFTVNAVDGTDVPLRSNIFVSGEDKSDLSLVLGVILCFPFLIMKGHNAELPAGTVKTLFTNIDVTVDSNIHL